MFLIAEQISESKFSKSIFCHQLEAFTRGDYVELNISINLSKLSFVCSCFRQQPLIWSSRVNSKRPRALINFEEFKQF